MFVDALLLSDPSCWRLRMLNLCKTSSILILFFPFSLQCRPSKGRRRGYCWCVDKYGQPLPGFDGRERGETQCYNLESKWEDRRDAQWTERGGQRIRGRGRGGGCRQWKKEPTLLLHVVLCKHLKGLWTFDFGSRFCRRVRESTRGRGPAKPPVLHSYLSCA